MRIGYYLAQLRDGEEELAEAFHDVAAHHVADTEAQNICHLLARWSEAHVRALQPLLDEYGTEDADEPHRLRTALFHGPRTGGLGLLHDLQNLYVMTTEVRMTWHLLNQAAKAVHDAALQEACVKLGGESERQLDWLYTHLSISAPQALIAAEK